jgi:hypothetical protein
MLSNWKFFNNDCDMLNQTTVAREKGEEGTMRGNSPIHQVIFHVNLNLRKPHLRLFRFILPMNASTMASLHRILIKTHRMTSRKKILAITKAAKRLSCSVVLKTEGPPGIMMAEGNGALEWMEVVRVS